jgi:transcriptional regulator with XRE-family HTH domain
MEPRIAEVANRIRALREDAELTMQEMAEAAGCTVAEYAAMESGTQDLTFTFLYRCAERLGVDIVDLLTGEGSHLTGCSLVRAGKGLSISRRGGFEYRHLAATFRHRLCEPFVVTAPYREDEQHSPIHLSQHDGQELDYVLSGRLRFVHEGHTEELGAGDAVFYDSGRGHGMIATGGAPCTFLAVVLKGHDAEIL